MEPGSDLKRAVHNSHPLDEVHKTFLIPLPSSIYRLLSSTPSFLSSPSGGRETDKDLDPGRTDNEGSWLESLPERGH